MLLMAGQGSRCSGWLPELIRPELRLPFLQLRKPHNAGKLIKGRHLPHAPLGGSLCFKLLQHLLHGLCRREHGPAGEYHDIKAHFLKLLRRPRRRLSVFRLICEFIDIGD